MTPQQWRLARRVVALLGTDIGRRDADLAGKLGVTLAELKPVLGALYGQHRIDFAAGYAFLPPTGSGREASAA